MDSLFNLFLSYGSNLDSLFTFSFQPFIKYPDEILEEEKLKSVKRLSECKNWSFDRLFETIPVLLGIERDLAGEASNHLLQSQALNGCLEFFSLLYYLLFLFFCWVEIVYELGLLILHRLRRERFKQRNKADKQRNRIKTNYLRKQYY